MKNSEKNPSEILEGLLKKAKPQEAYEGIRDLQEHVVAIARAETGKVLLTAADIAKMTPDEIEDLDLGELDDTDVEDMEAPEELDLDEQEAEEVDYEAKHMRLDDAGIEDLLSEVEIGESGLIGEDEAYNNFDDDEDARLEAMNREFDESDEGHFYT